VTAAFGPRVRIRHDGLTFHVRLTPRGGRDAIEGWQRASDGASHLKVRVRVAPESGNANAALIALIAESLGIPRTSIGIIGGQKARLKTVAVAGDTAALARKLEEFGEAQ
jgi:uncharacterized protein YggU (UPF0235/DUF167 family)